MFVTCCSWFSSLCFSCLFICHAASCVFMPFNFMMSLVFHVCFVLCHVCLIVVQCLHIFMFFASMAGPPKFRRWDQTFQPIAKCTRRCPHHKPSAPAGQGPGMGGFPCTPPFRFRFLHDFSKVLVVRARAWCTGRGVPRPPRMP